MPKAELKTPPGDQRPDAEMVTYAVISDRWSGTTKILHIPFPYWQLDYSNIEPLNEELPRINIQVMDADNPNRFIRSISLIHTDFRAYKEKPELREKQWTETFYEGHRSYYFVINARCIKSYTLEIKVPKKYV
ncbi:hypothetical protein ASZ90_011063 [hydrocarbon metagenome]|uniref:Uncharacterized protein n=1 Tax=hydrocarbon metagenome TaxID=938273 RepID=A0A0W8FES8_9ZZZZ